MTRTKSGRKAVSPPARRLKDQTAEEKQTQKKTDVLQQKHKPNNRQARQKMANYRKQASQRRGRYSTRVGTRQARGMDTPKANKLRHEEVVTAAPRVGTRQARGMDTAKANKLCLEKVDCEFATNGMSHKCALGAGRGVLIEQMLLVPPRESALSTGHPPATTHTSPRKLPKQP